ncbi:chemotaxis protein CheX [Arcobacter sp. FWKO B]|uniref:chemotaxis protein CheX n=1 Tax=Arcobacter sp. FWKO B TaxID=2593672 RepID=UPI0018A42F7D|nr:chemotaxis protein CheX [Arcobacter sp. FWKO B]QOG12897.1 chemotaxis protein CheX [Arcobacter sp. FWKO B]
MILDSLILQTKLFLQEDMGIEIKGVKSSILTQDKLELKDYTSMIGVGGKLNIMVVISYDEKMLQKLVELFMEGEEVDPSEAEEIIDSVAGETINTIMGLALPTFPNRGKGVTITPPIAINDASNIIKQKSAKIVSAEVDTNFGKLSISAVGTDESIK